MASGGTVNYKFLRGACVIIESGDTQIMCDPWLTDGEYYGSWAHYPPYDWSDDLSNLTHIYVSHIHPDHFSAATMARLPKVPVLIHQFNSKFLKHNIEALGFEVRELPHNIPIWIDDIKVNIVAADDCNPEVCGKFFGCTSEMVGDTQIDSMAIFDDGKHVYANVNDCPYELSRTMLPKVALQYPEIDLMMVAYAGAGPYPQCFAMTNREKEVASQIKKHGFLKHAVGFAEALRPKKTLPFAGDYVLQGKLAALNPYRGVATLPEVYGYFDTCGVPLERIEIPDELARQRYIRDVLAKRKLDYEADIEPGEKELGLLMLEASKRMKYMRDKLGFSSKTSVLLNNSLLILDDGRTIADISGAVTLSTPYIKITVDPRLLYRILSGPRHAHWNNAEIGSHIQFDRKPDKFERGIHHIMSFMHV